MAESRLIRKIAEFRKNAGEVVHVKLQRYGGCDLLDIRIHFEASDGVWRPTKKGISIDVELIPALQAAIEQAAQAVREMDGDVEEDESAAV